MTKGIISAAPTDAVMLAIIHAFAFPEREAWGPDAIAITLGLPGAFGRFQPGAGMILARVVAEDAEVLTLAVAPAQRRQGLGLALLLSAMGEAARGGATALFLEVSTGNEAARRLYDRAGFAQVGRRPQYYADGSDALVLRAPLTVAAGKVE